MIDLDQVWKDALEAKKDYEDGWGKTYKHVPDLYWAIEGLLLELRAARRVIEAAKSVATEDEVRDSLLCFVMGGELLDSLDAYDAVVKK